MAFMLADCVFSLRKQSKEKAMNFDGTKIEMMPLRRAQSPFILESKRLD